MSATTTTSAVTDVPVIKVDGLAVFRTGIQSVCVRKSLNAVAHAQIRVRADDGDAAKAKVDSALTLAVTGDTGSETLLFEGEIVSVGVELRRMGAELVIDAYDQGHRLMRRGPVATHLTKKPSDIIRTIVSEAGLSASVAAFGGTYDVFHQSGSAGRCIDDLCRSFGAEWWIEGSTFHARERTTTPAASGVTLSAGLTLRTFAVRFSGGEQVQNQTTRGWDVQNKAAIVGSSPGVAAPVEQGPPTVTGTPARQDVHFWSPFVTDSTSATTVTKAAASESSVGVVTGRGECDADARITPGKTIEIDGMGAAWNGAYYVTGVEHLLGLDQPFITRFTIGGVDDRSLLDLLGESGTASSTRLLQGLTIGIVTNNKDAGESLKLNRVKVKFPYLSDSDESQWARVVVPGGGKQRGLVQLPEVDDEVLVGFENGDPSKPVVLGGLWNGRDLPPLNTSSAELWENAVSSRQWVSRLGHRIVLADKAGSDQLIKIELGDKKTFVTLTKDKGVVVNAKDQPIELTNGKSSITLAANGDVTIKGAKVTIQATGDVAVEGANTTVTGKANLNLEGKAQLAAKGGGKASFEASGITEIKGSMVKVN